MQGIVDEERQRDHPHPPSARRVATGRACLGYCSSSPMSPHRLVVTPATQARRARNKHHRIYGMEHLASLPLERRKRVQHDRFRSHRKVFIRL